MTEHLPNTNKTLNLTADTGNTETVTAVPYTSFPINSVFPMDHYYALALCMSSHFMFTIHSVINVLMRMPHSQ